jgi:copper chaperone
MALKLTVPNIACDDCASTISESIHVMEPDAKVDVDVKGKTVTVESKASEESIKQAIVAAGYTVEGYQKG